MAVAPQNIMAQLRGMPDAELAKYAAMHKNDPFIFPLAFQESQTRKHLRAAKDMQMAGVQQPKVVDQDLQQMMPQPAPVQQPVQLPENIGIGQLPAQNLQRMADGGIVAFEEGGYVPRFSGVTDGSAIRDVYNMTPEEIKEQAARKLKMEAARAGLSGTPQAAAAAAESPGFLQSAKNALGSLRPAGLAGWGFATHVGDLNANEEAELKKRWAESDKYKFDVPESTIKGTGDTSEIDNMFDKGKGSKGKGSKDSANATKPVPRPSINPNAAANKPGAGAPAQNAATPAANSGLSGLAAYVKEGNEYTGPSPLEGQKARLDKQEAQAVTDKKDALNMALMKAGLGMMAGRSQYALQNIAEGGKGGLEDYAASMKDLRQAAKERDKMRNELENAAYAYKRDDVKGYQTHMEKAQDRATDLQRTQMQVDATLKAAQTSAGAQLAAAKLPPREAQMAAMLGTGSTFEERFQSGLPKLTAIQAGKFDPRKAYSEYLVAAQRANTGEIMPYAEFAMQFAPRVSGGQGQVLPRAD